jgi:hypothetical protein
LSAIKAGRKRVNGDHQRHTDSQPQRGQDGAAAAAAKLGEHIGHKEHSDSFDIERLPE